MGRGLVAPGSSCWIRPFSTAAVSAPATGNVHGLGLSKAWPWCVNPTIYSIRIPPQQECPAFLLHGAGCLGATGVPTTHTLSGPCQKGEVSSNKGLLGTSHLLPPFLLAPSAMQILHTL